MAEVPQILTVEQASKLLQLGRSKTYELTVEWEQSDHASGIPFVWLGKQKRIPLAALMQWIDRQLEPPAA